MSSILSSKMLVSYIFCYFASSTNLLHAEPSAFDPIDFNVSDQFHSPTGEQYSFVGVTLDVDLNDRDIRLLTNKRPGLKLTGTTGLWSWQFVDVQLEDPGDPLSRVLNARLDLVIENWAVGDVLTGLSIVEGGGVSSGPDLAVDYGSIVVIDTGSSRFHVAKDGSLVSEAWKDQEAILGPSAANGFFVKGLDGVVYSSRWGSCDVAIERNGPACSVISIEGDLVSPDGTTKLSRYRCELIAYAGSDVLRGSIGLIEDQGSTPGNVSFEWAEVACRALTDNSPTDVVLSYKDGSTQSQQISQLEDVRTVLHSSESKVVQRFADETESVLASETNPALFDHDQSICVTSLPSGRSMIFRSVDAGVQGPSGLECSGNGWIGIGLWPRPTSLGITQGAYAELQSSGFRRFTLQASSAPNANLGDVAQEQSLVPEVEILP